MSKPREYRWASVSAREWPATGSHTHLVRKGSMDSLCGTTAMPHTLWRGTVRKPKCRECVARAQSRPDLAPLLA